MNALAPALGLLLATAGPAAAPFPDLSTKLDVVPPELSAKLKGKPVAAARWTDKLGLNVVVLAETKLAETDKGSSQHLHGYHFVREGQAAWRALWQTTDGVSGCEFDLILELRPRALSITDTDGDGTAESGYAYVAGCGSDVSPDPLKVILHEGDKKFALRGSTRVQVGADDRGRPQYEGGDRKPDAALAAAPALLAHAQKLFDEGGGKQKNEKIEKTKAKK